MGELLHNLAVIILLLFISRIGYRICVYIGDELKFAEKFLWIITRMKLLRKAKGKNNGKRISKNL